MLTGPGRLNSSGFGMIDAVMALCITTLGVLALLSTMPIGWVSAGSTDMRSRAAEILRSELESTEALIMNRCNIVVTGQLDKDTFSSGKDVVTPNAGDRAFHVTKNIVLLAPDQWRVTVVVSWAGNAGITTSRAIVRHSDYNYPAGCLDDSINVSFN